jgi:CrcB protein
MTYVWVAFGSAIGGLLRYALSRLMEPWSGDFPFGTLLVNVLGCFVLGYFGTLTLQGGRYEVSDNLRLFVMVGLCGGFTTFSSFSLQTLSLLREDAWGRALANVVVSVLMCLLAVSAGHLLAQRSNNRQAIVQTADEFNAG